MAPSPASLDTYLARLAELECRYDGPIPACERRKLEFGSLLAAEIAETKAEIAFFRTLVQRAREAAKARRRRGDRPRAAALRNDAWLYLHAWRKRRHKLAELLQEFVVREARADIARQRTLAMIDAAIVAPLVTGVEETGL